MEASVKAIGYGGFFRTNSADVKNIAHGEQSHCLSVEGAVRYGKPRIAANLMETRTQPCLISCRVDSFSARPNGKRTALTYWLIPVNRAHVSGQRMELIFVSYRRIEVVWTRHLVPQRAIVGNRAEPGLRTHPDVPRRCAARRAGLGGAVALSGPPFQGRVIGNDAGSAYKWLFAAGT